jgi:hypothetical protein
METEQIITHLLGEMTARLKAKIEANSEKPEVLRERIWNSQEKI